MPVFDVTLLKVSLLMPWPAPLPKPWLMKLLEPQASYIVELATVAVVVVVTVDKVQLVGLDSEEAEVVLASQVKLCGSSDATVVTWP